MSCSTVQRSTACAGILLLPSLLLWGVPSPAVAEDLPFFASGPAFLERAEPAGELVEFDADGSIWSSGNGAGERLFGSIPWLAVPDAGPTSFTDSSMPGDLDAWFPRANNDPLGAELTLVGFPTPMSLLGVAKVRVRGEYGTNFDDHRRTGGQIYAIGRGWAGIDAAFDHREIDLPRGRENGLWTGDANLVFRLPEVRMLNMRAGVGANWLHDGGETDVGYNLTYSADVFIKRPWLLSGEIDWGQVGSEQLFHGRATFGLMLGNFEVYTGYDYYEAGRLELDGLVGGAGIWF